jgi:transcriptional regulator with XRE-family HTH domain
MNNQKLRQLREKARMSQADLAEILGITQTAVSKWELGQGMPRVSMLPRIAKVLRCKVADFF